MKVVMYALLWLAAKPVKNAWAHHQHKREIREYYLTGVFGSRPKPNEDFATWRRNRERRQRVYI